MHRKKLGGKFKVSQNGAFTGRIPMKREHLVKPFVGSRFSHSALRAFTTGNETELGYLVVLSSTAKNKNKMRKTTNYF